MAKRVNSVTLKGILHSDNQIEEVNKKTQTSELFDVNEILQEFHGKTVSITIKEEKPVQSLLNSASFSGEDDED